MVLKLKYLFKDLKLLKLFSAYPLLGNECMWIKIINILQSLLRFLHRPFGSYCVTLTFV